MLATARTSQTNATMLNTRLAIITQMMIMMMTSNAMTIMMTSTILTMMTNQYNNNYNVFSKDYDSANGEEVETINDDPISIPIVK